LNFYNSFIKFCEKNNLTKAQGIEILEKQLEGERQDEQQQQL
jgi:hypothetical protein